MSLTQNTLFGCFAKVTRLEREVPAFDMENWEEQASQDYEHQFAIHEPGVHYTDEEAFWKCDYILVLTEVRAQLDGILGSNADFMQMAVLRSSLEPFRCQQAPVETPDPPALISCGKEWTDDPWMVN